MLELGGSEDKKEMFESANRGFICLPFSFILILRLPLGIGSHEQSPHVEKKRCNLGVCSQLRYYSYCCCDNISGNDMNMGEFGPVKRSRFMPPQEGTTFISYVTIVKR